MHTGGWEAAWSKLTKRFLGGNCEHIASWTMLEAEMNLSLGKPRYYSSNVENGFSTDTNRFFFSLSNSCLLLQEINSARYWTMFFSLPGYSSNRLTVSLHCWPAVVCSLHCFVGYSRPDVAYLILCLVISTLLLHVVDKFEKCRPELGHYKDFQAEEIAQLLAQIQ